MSAHAPDSAPTPLTGLSFRVLHDDCIARAEQLEARAAYHQRSQFDPAAWQRCRDTADRLRDFAPRWERLKDVDGEVLEHRRNLLSTDYQDLCDECDRLLS